MLRCHWLSSRLRSSTLYHRIVKRQSNSMDVRNRVLASTLATVAGMLLLCFVGASQAHGRIMATDDHGDVLILRKPAERIIGLAPNIVELLFAAGAGEQVAGAVEYSDFPEQARSIPRIGNFGSLNLEAMLALRPDLIVAWGSGSPAAQVQRLRELGIPVYVIEPRRLIDIANHIEKLGGLAGTQATAGAAADAFRTRLQALRRQYAGKPELEIFYEVWNEPLTTIGGRHLISKVMRLCGGRNVFGDLRTLAPQINVEAVLVHDPAVIIAGRAGRVGLRWLDAWRKYADLKAVKQEHLFASDPDLLQRHTPRILRGAAIMCRQLEQVRADASNNSTAGR